MKNLENTTNPGYDYEITKIISLRQINPFALIQLTKTAKCEFSFSEFIFDLDYPGHYNRRVKTLLVSIPCITEPYTSINATLTLIKNKYRNTSILGEHYAENAGSKDNRFSTFKTRINSVALSTCYNDAGMVTNSSKDDLYMPFEGAGVQSIWSLELPAIRQFDYNTITDVIVQMTYTSNEGGILLKKAAKKACIKYIESNKEFADDQGLFIFIDLRNDYPDNWGKSILTENGKNHVTIELFEIDNKLPYFLKNNTSLRGTDFSLITDVIADDIYLNNIPFKLESKKNTFPVYKISGIALARDTWKLFVPEQVQKSEYLLLIIRLTA